MAAILFAVIDRYPVFATHEKYENYSIWVCVLSLGIEYFISVVRSLFNLSSDELFDLTYNLLGRLEWVVKIHIVNEFIFKALAHDWCYIFNTSIQEKIKILLKLQVEGGILKGHLLINLALDLIASHLGNCLDSLPNVHEKLSLYLLVFRR